MSKNLRLNDFQPQEEYVYLTYSLKNDKKEESRVLPMEKKNTRDWSKYDENVVTRYKLMFPLLRLRTLVGITPGREQVC